MFEKIDIAYIRNFILLLSGTVVSQVVTVLLSPVLSRLYSPSEFGIFSTYSSTISILTVVCCGRYELAISLPKQTAKAFEIVKFCIVLSLCIALLVLPSAFIFYFISPIPDAAYVFLLPLVVVVSAVNISLVYFHNKIENFKYTSQSKVVQSVFTGILSSLIFFCFNKYGLVLASFLGQLTCSIFLIHKLPKEFKRIFFKSSNFGTLKLLAKEFKQFPKFTLFPAFLNIFSSQSINYFFIFVFGSIAAGNYFFSSRIVLLPTSVIGAAFTDILFQKVISKKNDGELVFPFFITNTIYLFLISFALFLLIYIFSPALFDIVFGQDWKEAGELCRFLAISMFFRLLVSPLTVLFIALDKVRLSAYWQYFSFILYGILLVYLAYAKINFVESVLYLSMYDLVVYIIAFICLIVVVRNHDRALVNK